MEVDEPQLFLDIFPYKLPPKIVFDSKEAPLGGDISQRVLRITDTTFRDGQQARPPYTVEQIVKLYQLIGEISGPNGIISQSEFFVYSDKDKEAVIACLEQKQPFPEVTGWIRGLKEDAKLLEWMAKNGIKETGLLTSSSDYHIFIKLGKDRKKALDEYISMVERALENNIRPRCHLEDVTRADIYGFVIPFVQKLMEKSEQVDENLKIKLRLCDTLGFGVPYSEAALPMGIPKLVSIIRYETGIPSQLLEWHGHNDFGHVHSNAAVAWLYGCNNLNSTLLGFGERTGNPPMEAAVFEYARLKGTLDRMNTKAITYAADYLREIGVQIAKDKPFTGKNINQTSAGIHADGMGKDERIYLPFDSRELLGREPWILITDKSGYQGVRAYIKFLLKSEGLLPKEPTPQDNRSIRRAATKIAGWVDEQYKGGLNTSISPEVIDPLIMGQLPQYFKPTMK